MFSIIQQGGGVMFFILYRGVRFSKLCSPNQVMWGGASHPQYLFT